MSTVFLTEGHRLRPRKAQKPKANHPWGGGHHPRTAHVATPVLTIGSEDDHSPHIPASVGCYHTLPKRGDQ